MYEQFKKGDTVIYKEHAFPGEKIKGILLCYLYAHDGAGSILLCDYRISDYKGSKNAMSHRGHIYSYKMLLTETVCDYIQ